MSKLILISGVSRSGKSSLAQALSQKLENSIILDQDDFIKPKNQLPRIHDRIDWEKPETMDWNKWQHAITSAMKSYDYVIAEGIFTLSDSENVGKADIAIELKATKQEFLERRKLETRWGEEPEWFLEHVWESHLKFHNPKSINLDFSIHNWKQNHLTSILKTLA